MAHYVLEAALGALAQAQHIIVQQIVADAKAIAQYAQEQDKHSIVELTTDYV